MRKNVVFAKGQSVKPVTNVSVYAILKDADQNVIGFSKTIVDVIPPESTSVAPFTWPIDRQGAVISIDIRLAAE